MIKIIKLQEVSKKISKRIILDKITLEFQKGNIYGLIGNNGSGKTMLLRLICDLVKPSSGEISRTKGITYGVIIENPGFLYEETALFNLEYLASINNKIGKDRIMEVLKYFKLEKYKDVKVKKYSLGMQQKLGLAQAIMEYPDVLLLDEPFNALDDESYQDTKKILLDLRDNYNTTIIIATYDKGSFNIFVHTIKIKDVKIQ